MDQTRITLPESEMPAQWYNINPDLPAPPAVARASDGGSLAPTNSS